MIVETKQDYISEKHIAFFINSEGYNDFGLAEQVLQKYWNELANRGEHKIGTVLSKVIGEKTFHALVCYSLHDGWGKNQAHIIKELFDKITANGEPIATVLVGNKLVGMKNGANLVEMLCGMHDSEQQIILHCGYDLGAVMNTYNEEKIKLKTKKDK